MDWFNTLNNNLQIVIISSITSLLILFIKFIWERFSFRYKMLKEFQFEQKKKLKEEIMINKSDLLNAVEELNHRLWNFSQNINEKKINISKSEWFKSEQYYLNSFIFRFLKVIYYTIQIENSAKSIDPKISNKEDLIFMKYIKTFKDMFTDRDLINNHLETRTTHFHKNNLRGFLELIENGNTLYTFTEFEKVLEKNYEKLQPVIEYISKIENKMEDPTLNILKCFHLLSISFLNKYGFDYQKTENEKINKITQKYKTEIFIKTEFYAFIKKSKLDTEKEIKYIISKLIK